MPGNSTAPAKPAPVTLFYSYAHEDEKLRAGLERHLKILQLRGLIQPWHDRAIVPGQRWDGAIGQQLNQAELVLLLLSADFMGSDYILEVELKTALRRAAEGSATVVPILLRPLDLEGLDGDDLPMALMLQRQGLPRDLKPVTSWRQREEAWVSVSKGLRAAVSEIQARRAAQPLAAMAAAPGLALGAALERMALAPVDPLLEQVLDSAAAGVLAAHKLRCGMAGDAMAGIEMVGNNTHSSHQATDTAALRAQAMALINADHTPRLLWVDDHPDANLAEVDMLARLQIEVVQVRSTAAALAWLQADTEGFDLVLSDWQRAADAADAGLQLQQGLLQLAQAQAVRPWPLVIYHGAFGQALRLQRAERARSAGVFGEAVLPGELLALVQAALAR